MLHVFINFSSLVSSPIVTISEGTHVQMQKHEKPPTSQPQIPDTAKNKRLLYTVRYCAFYRGTHQFDLFCTSIHRLYLDPNFTSFFWRNLTSRPISCPDLQNVDVQRPKYASQSSEFDSRSIGRSIVLAEVKFCQKRSK